MIDVRSRPYSKVNPDFSYRRLKALCAAADMDYLFLGKQLGGQPPDAVLDAEGKINYIELAQRDTFRSGIQQITTRMAKGKISCLVCSESDPRRCHRAFLIGETLHREGVEVRHIDMNGVWIHHQELMIST